MKKDQENKIVVLHLIRSLSGRGGTPRKLLGLVRNAKNVKHIVHMFHNRHLHSHGVTVVNDLKKAGAIVEETWRPKTLDLRYAIDVVRLISKHKPDVINTHFPRSDVYGAVVGFLTRVPVIKSVHGIPYSESRLVRWLDRLVARSRRVTVSNSYATMSAEFLRTGVSRAAVIHNGVEPRKVSTDIDLEDIRTELGIPRKGFLVGHIGGLTEWRSQITLIKAIKELLDRKIKCYCVIIGDGAEKQALATAVKELDVEAYVKLPGQRDDIGRCLESFNVYVNPAVEEGFGIAVVEAMFTGLPVVLAEAGALPELIENGSSGLLFPSKDEFALADAIEQLLLSPSLVDTIGKGAQHQANAKFSLSVFARKWEDLYMNVVQNCDTSDVWK